MNGWGRPDYMYWKRKKTARKRQAEYVRIQNALLKPGGCGGMVKNCKAQAPVFDYPKPVNMVFIGKKACHGLGGNDKLQ